MNYQKIMDKLEYLKHMLEKECTGTAKELAGKLGISRRTLFNYFDLLKDQGYNIRFSRYRKTYYFYDSI